jgi:3-hydroxyisobutyrate dehydrogenase
MTKVAFIGTGLLGSAMVEGMLRRGDAVTVWNRTESKARALERFGATVAPVPADAAAGADRVHMTLPEDAVVDRILADIAPRLQRDAIVVDHSTTAPNATQSRVRRMAESGVRFLHAPVFMSPAMARDSIGLMLVAGPPALFDTVQGDLAKMTGEAWYLGNDGQRAAALKIFGNSMIFVITAGLADVFAMAKGLGIAPEDAISVFSKFQAGGVIMSRGEKIARGDFTATFELTMARKDLRLMLEAAAGQPMVALPAIAKRMDESIAHGHGRDDLAVIAADAMA